MLRRLAASLLSAALVAVATQAMAAPSAADKETARSLIADADRKLAARDVKGALQSFQAAHAIMNVPTTGLEVAKAQEALGLLVEARDTAISIERIPEGAHDPKIFKDARVAAAELAARLAPRIPAVVIKVDAPAGADVRVEVDGAAVPAAALGLPRKQNPGSHKIVATAAGLATATASVELREGETKEVALRLVPGAAAAGPRPDAPPPAAPAEAAGGKSYTLAIIGFAIGGAGLAAGAVTGGLSLGKASSAKSGCAGTVCPTSHKADADASLTLATVSDITFGVGAAGVALGVYGLVTAKPKAPPSTGLFLSPNSARFVAKF